MWEVVYNAIAGGDGVRRGVKDSDEIPDKEICHSQRYHTVMRPCGLTRGGRWTQQGHPSDRSNQFVPVASARVSPQIQQRLRCTCDRSLGEPRLPRHGSKQRSGVGGKAEWDGELIHLKSFFTPPHHPHCDLNTILVTAVIESLKST